MRSVLILIPILFFSLGVTSQVSFIDPLLEAYVSRNSTEGEMIDLFVHGDPTAIRSFTTSKGGIFKRELNTICAIRIPVLSVNELAAKEFVDGFEFSLTQGQILNDSMRVNNKVIQVHTGEHPLQMPFDGSGTVVGIIDSGIELNHPDFQDADGNTRVMKIWDQTFPFDAQLTPANYGYGQQWDSTMINAGQCPSVDQAGYFGHGSTVTGTAAGNGLATGSFQGVAKGADLLIVSNALNSANWYSTVVDAVEWIFDESEALGKPCVVNISLGSYFGSHDGLDAAALMIDDLIDQSTGRAVVCAAGNSGAIGKYHLHTEVGPDTNFTWFRHHNSTSLGVPSVWFDLWADTADFNNVRFAVGADKAAPYFEHRGMTNYFSVDDALNNVLHDTIWGTTGHLIGPVEWFAQLRGGQYMMRVIVRDADSTAYRFRFSTTGSGAFDVWSINIFGSSNMWASTPDSSDFPDVVNYSYPDDEQRIVDSWACSPNVITVANYYNETEYIDMNGDLQSVGGTKGAIVPTSSSGPTRDGRIKPDIGATGDVTLSSGPLDFLQYLIANEPFKVAPGEYHFRGGGTSIASPVVAGAVALYFEKCKDALHTEVKDAILNTADSDTLTGPVPNITWGHGKVNVFDALVSSNYNTELSVFGDNELCEGDSVLVSGQAMMMSYLWSHGDTVKVLHLSDPGQYYLTTLDQSGCIGISDTLDLIVHPLPPAPTINASGNLLASSIADQYQWFFEGVPIGGETGQQHEATISGNYYVQITDQNGCTANSDTLFVLVTGIDELNNSDVGIYPNPADNELFLTTEANFDNVVISILDERGRQILHTYAGNLMAGSQHLIDLSEIATGHYIVRFETSSEVFNLPLIRN